MSDAQGGPPPGWPQAPPAGAMGPGYTQPGDPAFSPSFPNSEGAPAGMPGPIAASATVVEPYVAEPLPGMYPGAGAAQPMGVPGPAGYGPAGYGPAGYGPGAYGAIPATAPPAARRSSTPLVVGIAAIVIGVSGAIGFALYWTHRSVDSDSSTPTPIEVPKKKKDVAAEDTTDKPAAPPDTPPPEPTPAPTPEPVKPTTPQPKPTTPQPKPSTTPTQPQPKPSNTTPAPKPTTPTPTQPVTPPGHHHIPAPR